MGHLWQKNPILGEFLFILYVSQFHIDILLDHWISLDMFMMKTYKYIETKENESYNNEFIFNLLSFGSVWSKRLTPYDDVVSIATIHNFRIVLKCKTIFIDPGALYFLFSMPDTMFVFLLLMCEQRKWLNFLCHRNLGSMSSTYLTKLWLISYSTLSALKARHHLHINMLLPVT